MLNYSLSSILSPIARFLGLSDTQIAQNPENSPQKHTESRIYAINAGKCPNFGMSAQEFSNFAKAVGRAGISARALRHRIISAKREGAFANPPR